MYKFDRNNFHKHTFCVFTEVAIDEIDGIKPNYTSKSGSVYFFNEDGVFRMSNHWGRAANCKWRLQSSDKKPVARKRLGYAKWTEFHPDNATEKLYFITVDFETKSASYQHKSNMPEGTFALLRTAAETEKIIKQIRNLLVSDSWSAHFKMEINLLRQTIITQLIHSSKTLQQIKSELLSK